MPETFTLVCRKYEQGYGPCGFCGHPGNVLCDFPTGDRDKTCDARCCKDCATSVGPNKDYCPMHANRKAPQ